MLNKKSLYSFLIITFSLTILITSLMAYFGLKVTAKNAQFAQYLLAGIMFIPALATVITRQFITHEGWADAGLKRGHFKDYFKVWLIIPILFIIVFLLTSIFGAPVDWNMSTFVETYKLVLPFPGEVMVLIIFLVSLFVAPWVNSLAAFGEELGWRGHLLPHLLPLGQKKALLISGLIWGLWHVPFVLLLGFGFYDNVWLGVLFFTTVITLLGVFVGYWRIRSGSTWLAAWAHGVFNSQGYGVWVMLFPSLNRYWGGVGGLAGILVFWVLAWYCFRLLEKHVKIEQNNLN